MVSKDANLRNSVPKYEGSLNISILYFYINNVLQIFSQYLTVLLSHFNIVN